MADRLAMDFDAIPAQLAALPQWLVWRFEEKPGDKKPRKVPYYIGGRRRVGTQGSAEDRAALATLDNARTIYETAKGKWTGIGFAFLPGDGLIGVDLDGMIDPGSRAISDRGRNIIEACASYTEFSPSGKGVHIICSGQTDTFKSNEVGVEVFCGRQYFTFTGNRYPGTPPGISPLPDKVLSRLRATVDSGRQRQDGKRSTAPPPELEGRAKVESALAYISPACGYDDWIQIGMAIHAELGAAGFDVWDGWSAKGDKYPGSAQLQGHWRSFKPGAGVSGATLFKQAMDGGWRPPKTRKQGAGQSGGSEPPAPPPDDLPPDLSPDDWRRRLIRKGPKIDACLANVHDMLANDESWQGVIAFDEFAQRVIKRKPPPYAGGVAGEWESTDDSLAAMWLSRLHKFSPSSTLVAEAVEVLARSHSFHPVRDWLKGLKWDGTPRIDRWIEDFLGVTQTEYTARVSAWFLIAMVARVMRPGVKFDYCLVLEGPQGRGKSSTLAILGGEWFGDTDIDLHNKDSMAALQGKWLYEFPELGSLARTEERRQKSFLSRQVDEYRPVYGRRMIKVPRQGVFCGSTNEWEWNKDPTGGRRFWPIEVGELNLSGLAAVRDQLFAEALVRFEQGERFYPTGDEQRLYFDAEQLRRERSESLVDLLHDWVFDQYDSAGNPKSFALATAATDGLKLEAGKLTRDLEVRIGHALKKLGCTRTEKRNGMVRFWYQAPAMGEPSPPPRIQEDGESVPF